ncbi:MAG: DUF222 domain-containing protein [Acidimicrobiia bacterium]|nr:DUF222 domain-containing protein [Acidimicrobiia bacterium]
MMLGEVDRSRLNGHFLVRVLQAEERQAAHYQARRYATMAEIAHCPPGSETSLPDRVGWDEFDDEFAPAEIATALRLTRRGGDIELGVAIDLWERLPRVGEALNSGLIDVRRAKKMINATCHLTEDDARHVVDKVVDGAGELTTGQLQTRLRNVVLTDHADTEKEHYQYGLEQRSVEAYQNPDGTANLVASSLPGDRVAAMMRRLTELAKTAQTPDDGRGIDQRRADVLTDLLLGDGNLPSTNNRGVVDLRVDLETLAGLNEAPGEIPGWGAVLSDIARQIALDNHDGEWRYTVTHPDSGAVLADGTTRRRPTARQERWVQARRPRCAFPGCRMPARDSDLDHTRSRTDGGHTVVENLEPLCRHHHRLKHETPWQLRRVDDTYVWTSPLGHTYTTNGQSP